jgi:L-amino acid N-acyltransferase YncA
MVETAAGITIREAGPSDCPAINRVFVSAIGAIDDSVYTEIQKRAWEGAIAPDSWPIRMLEFRFLVAEVDGQIVGFASYSENRIEDVYVHSDHERRGVGGKLLRKVFDLLDQTEISLTASLNAESFYRGFGFLVLERHSREVGSVQVPCIRMTRPVV